MDYGQRVADDAQDEIERRLKAVYQSAYDDLRKQLDKFVKQHEKADERKRQMKDEGLISEEDYQDWRKGQEFIGKQWQSKVDSAAQILQNASQEAMKIINGEQHNVYAENANWTAYNLEKDAKMSIGFGIYDADSVGNLLRNEPELLPRKVINKKKQDAWCRKEIANAVTQGIIEGDPLKRVAKRIAQQTASSEMKSMIRYARTAMTGAQNAGRMDTLHRATKMGIRVQKQWLATLDRRTRHSHQMLDGQIKDIDKPFESIFGDIMYPGDLDAENDADIWNCRCTMVYVYPDFSDLEENVERYDNEDRKPIEDMTYQEWKKAYHPDWKTPGQKGNQAETVRIAIANAIIDKLKANAFDGDFLDEYMDAIIESVRNADERMLRIVERTIDNVHVTWTEGTPLNKTSHYTPGTGHITIITKDAAGEMRTKEDLLQTFWHEYGHYVDDAGISKSGYGYKSEYGNYFFDGIQPEILKDDAWMYAARDDANNLLKFAGLSDHYECVFENGHYSAGIYKDGQWVDTRAMDFDTMNELENGLIKWANRFSGDISLDDYRRQFGYPEKPKREDYIEVYFTPKRHQYKEREVFKGARDAYNAVIQEYYKKVDEFESTHDMRKIYDEWEKLHDKAEKREKAVASATDTFDGGVNGAFSAFIMLGGHTQDYYSRNRMGANEGIANVFSALFTKDDVAIEAFQSLCPNIFNLIKGVILK